MINRDRHAQSCPLCGARTSASDLAEAGWLDPLALRERHGALADRVAEPGITADGVAFVLHDHDARSVQVLGSWDGWRAPGLPAEAIEPGVWRIDRESFRQNR